jgi:hypothetical protein
MLLFRFFSQFYLDDENQKRVNLQTPILRRSAAVYARVTDTVMVRVIIPNLVAPQYSFLNQKQKEIYNLRSKVRSQFVLRMAWSELV